MKQSAGYIPQTSKSMATGSLRIDEQKTHNPARPADARTARAFEGISPRRNPASRARHLDVDAVLERSLPKVAGRKIRTLFFRPSPPARFFCPPPKKLPPPQRGVSPPPVLFLLVSHL